MIEHTMKQISLRKKDGEWEIWIDPGQNEFGGMCIGASAIFETAKADGVATLRLAINDLHSLVEKDADETE